MSDEAYGDERWEREFSLAVTPDAYRGSIHDSLPVALKEKLENSESFREYFEIDEPNRVWVEGESSHYWDEAEDFVITGSAEGGEMIMGQVVSCNGKEYPYEKMESQLEYFVGSNMFSKEDVKDTWEHAFLLGVDLPSEAVAEEERRLKEAVMSDTEYEVDLLVQKIQLEEVKHDFDIDLEAL